MPVRADAGRTGPMSVTGVDSPEPSTHTRPGHPPDAPGRAARAEAVDVAIWLALAAFGAVVTVLVAAADVDLGTAGLPFRAGWDPRLEPAALLAPAVAAVTIAIARWGVRIRWGGLLALGAVGSLCWMLALGAAAGPGLTDGLRAAPEYLAAAETIGDDPLGYLSGYAEGAAAATEAAEAAGGTGAGGGTPAGHPGPALLVWVLTRLGLSDPVVLGVVLTALTALYVPIVTVAVRSLCHETAARRAVPALVLTPWALWAAASPAAVSVTVAATAVAVGVVGCEPGRRWRLGWALAAGVLLGLTGLFDYAAVWLGVAIAAAYFVRRRPLMNVLTGLGALLPLWLFHAWGFSWPDGLAAADTRAGLAVMLAWVLLDATVVLLLGGPVLVRALRRITLTPGWPFLVGAAATALFSLCAGLAWGGVEASWLPLVPWVLVAALAPRPRPAVRGDTVRAGDLPLILVGVGAATAVALRLLLAPF